MDEKVIYRLWRKYLAAASANTVTEWKKYLLSCLRANVFPPVARGLDFMGFVESVKGNVQRKRRELSKISFINES